MIADKQRRDGLTAPATPSRGRLSPITLGRVQLLEGFWGKRVGLVLDTTIHHALAWMRKLGWLDNFQNAAGGVRNYEHRGKEFSDSEVYKLIEAMSWALGTNDSAPSWIRRELDALVELVASAQDPDGYLHTRYGRSWQAPRYSDMSWGHELYCMGHLIQAGVAHHRSTGQSTLLDVAVRAADHICIMFGPDGWSRICGHPEVETALVELYRVTRNENYLRQARVFIERRGKGLLPVMEFGSGYWQDDAPVSESTGFHGHSVRALYLAAGIVDLAVESQDADLIDTLEQQWAHTVARRTYITGGMGSHHMDEAFGDDFVLPPDRAYSETCAGVASIMLAWRLLLATGSVQYADLIERTLFNVIATSLSDRGDSFFYANTLHQREHVPASLNDEGVVIRGGASTRQPWFEVSCCPPNISRLLTSLGGYVATTTPDAVQIHQFVPSIIDAEVHGGPVKIRVETTYPVSGTVKIQVETAPPEPFSLQIRVPTWADGAELTRDGRTSVVEAGQYVSVVVSGLESVVLNLPMQIRTTVPDPRIDAVRGCLAFERGPEVLAVESIDLPHGWSLDLVEATGRVEETPTGFEAELVQLTAPKIQWPYAGRTSPSDTGSTQRKFVPLVAYHSWANRGPSLMRIFLPSQSI